MSDLDFESETALLKTLGQIAQKHTVIVVTHSLRVASLARHIYHVRGDGSIEHDTPKQLLPQLFRTHREVTEVAENTSTTPSSAQTKESAL